MPVRGATASRWQQPAVPGRCCQSSALGRSRSPPARSSHPETPGWSSRALRHPADKHTRNHAQHHWQEMNRECKNKKQPNETHPPPTPKAYFIKTRHDVAQIDPGRACFSDLVEQVISEELQQIPIPCLGPRRILLKSGAFQTRRFFTAQKQKQDPTGANNLCLGHIQQFQRPWWKKKKDQLCLFSLGQQASTRYFYFCNQQLWQLHWYFNMNPTSTHPLDSEILC